MIKNIKNNEYVKSVYSYVNCQKPPKTQKSVVFKNNRRPKRGRAKLLTQSVNMFNCNAAGIQNKLFSLSKIIKDQDIKIWCLQETHSIKNGQIKFDGSDTYQIYEVIREGKLGGGLAIGVDKSLSPVWVGQGEGGVEAMTISVSFKQMLTVRKNMILMKRKIVFGFS